MWVPISEASKRFNCSKRTVWRKISDGELESREQNGIRLVEIPNETEIKSTGLLRGGEKGMDEKIVESNITKKKAAISLDLLQHLHRLKNLVPPAGEEEANVVISDAYKKIYGGELDEMSLKKIFTGLLNLRAQWINGEKELIEDLKPQVFIPQEEHEMIHREVHVREVALKEATELFECILSGLRKIIVLGASEE